MSERNGNRGPSYGMGEAGDRVLAALEKLLREHDAGLLASLLKVEPGGRREIIEICDEGVAKFEAASQEVAPLQKVAVGIAYTANALREWRERGPLSAG